MDPGRRRHAGGVATEGQRALLKQSRARSVLGRLVSLNDMPEIPPTKRQEADRRNFQNATIHTNVQEYTRMKKTTRLFNDIQYTIMYSTAKIEKHKNSVFFLHVEPGSRHLHHLELWNNYKCRIFSAFGALECPETLCF